MADITTAPLSPTHRSICDRCGNLVWVYSMQSGETVALNFAPGEFIVDGRNHVYRTTGLAGYAQHACEASRRARLDLARTVRSDEFLWA